MMDVLLKKRVVLSAVLLSAAITLACSTPVFRYAIERWEADPYRLVVFSNGALTEEQQKVVAGFKEYGNSGYRSSPLIVDEYDISSTNGLAVAVRAGLPTNRAAPCVALLYPEFMRMDKVIWNDDLTTNALNRIVMSPARLEIARRLLDGDATVWVFIPGRDAEKNRAVHEMLDTKLRELETAVEFNENFLELAKEAGAEPPKLKFSVLEVSRDNRQEAPLMAMLTQVSDSIATNSGPIVVPIFGQGRAAVLMMDEYLTGSYVESIVQFLTGACSCEVKAQNPGFDILIPVDWVGGIKQEYVFDAELPPLKSPSAEMETLLSATNRVAGTAEKAGHRLFGAVLGVFIVIVLSGLAGVTWMLLRKKRNHESS
jgi:hypothetical protein